MAIQRRGGEKEGECATALYYKLEGDGGKTRREASQQEDRKSKNIRTKPPKEIFTCLVDPAFLTLLEPRPSFILPSSSAQL